MKIKNKLVSLLAAAIGGLLLLGGIGLYGLLRTLESMEDIGHNHLPSVEALLILKEGVTDMSRNLYAVNAAERQPSLERKKAELEVAYKRRVAAMKRAEKAIADYEALPATDEEKVLWDKTKKQWSLWLSMEMPVQDQHKKTLENPTDDGIRQLADAHMSLAAQRRTVTAEFTQNLQAVVDYNHKAGFDNVANAVTMAEKIKFWEMLLFAALLTGLSLLGWTIIRAIMGPLQLAEETVNQISASNDLTKRVNYSARNEIGSMVTALNAMLDTTQDSMRTIQGKINLVQESATALTGASSQVAESSAVQSNSASAMAASIEELTVSINTVSDSANDAKTLAQQSAQASREGGDIIDKTVAEIGNIDIIVSRASAVIGSLGEDSQRISAVVQVIKDVADQTNLLALNAAIEAARAGEQGRGFAVVADEVRKLAERTTQSTLDIAAMIDTIQKSAKQAVSEMEQVVEQVASGKEMANDAGVRIQEIRQAAERVTDAISEISGALNEQSIASLDIARHVESIAQMTDENQAAAENAAGSANQVDALATDVTQIIARFNV